MVEFRRLTKKDYGVIRKIYKYSFPKAERKPFVYLLYQQFRKKAVLYALYDKSKIVALCFLLNGKGKYMLLDYLAVDKNFRNKGYGGEILAGLNEIYNDKYIIAEVEDPENAGAEEKIRKKRIEFYNRNGIRNTGVKSKYFGSDMLLLCSDENLTYKDYENISKYSFGLLGGTVVKYYITKR